MLTAERIAQLRRNIAFVRDGAAGNRYLTDEWWETVLHALRVAEAALPLTKHHRATVPGPVAVDLASLADVVRGGEEPLPEKPILFGQGPRCLNIATDYGPCGLGEGHGGACFSERELMAGKSPREAPSPSPQTATAQLAMANERAPRRLDAIEARLDALERAARRFTGRCVKCEYARCDGNHEPWYDARTP